MLESGAVKCWGRNHSDEQNRGDGPEELGAALPAQLAHARRCGMSEAVRTHGRASTPRRARERATSGLVRRGRSPPTNGGGLQFTFDREADKVIGILIRGAIC